VGRSVLDVYKTMRINPYIPFTLFIMSCICYFVGVVMESNFLIGFGMGGVWFGAIMGFLSRREKEG
jgi:uncharacterized membrane protein